MSVSGDLPVEPSIRGQNERAGLLSDLSGAEIKDSASRGAACHLHSNAGADGYGPFLSNMTVESDWIDKNL
jgi:hypothetical protein